MQITVEAWAEIVVKEWVKKARALGISPGDPLTDQRFLHHVITNANGDPVRVQFTFDYYLKFVNWGVGRGVNLENRDILISQGKTTRRRKPWYDDVFYKQIAVLGHLLAEKYAIRSQLIIKTNLETMDYEGHSVSTVPVLLSDNVNLVPRTTRKSPDKIDSVTGKKKISYSEFQERRKNW